MNKHPDSSANLQFIEWIHGNSISFSLEFSDGFTNAVQKIVASLNEGLVLLGLGEALHGGEEILIFRNLLFRYLVQYHGFSAIAIESSLPRGRFLNTYGTGDQPRSYEIIKDTGFSHGFGLLERNRELLEWIREYNSDPQNTKKVHIYGFDSPTEMTHTDSPRGLLTVVLEYLSSLDHESGTKYKENFDILIGDDGKWENPEAMMNPECGIGLSSSAHALRILTEDLISELQYRCPEYIAKSSREQYQEALHYAESARQLMNYHAVLAERSTKRVAKCLGIRDAMMADNLRFIIQQEAQRGKVLAFGHSMHLKKTGAEWQLGPTLLKWWPAGSHLNSLLGTQYAVIGSGVLNSEENGIGSPELGSFESYLTASKGPARLLSLDQKGGLPSDEIKKLKTRSGSMKNQSYFPLTNNCISDFDFLVIFDSLTYTRGGPPLAS